MIRALNQTITLVLLTSCSRIHNTTTPPTLHIDGSPFAVMKEGKWIHTSGEVLAERNNHILTVPGQDIEINLESASQLGNEDVKIDMGHFQIRIDDDDVYFNGQNRGTISGNLTKEDEWFLLSTLAYYKEDSPTTVTTYFGHGAPPKEPGGPLQLGKYTFSATAHDDGRLTEGKICDPWEPCEYSAPIGHWDETSITIGDESLNLERVFRSSELATVFSAGSRPVFILKPGYDEPRPSINTHGPGHCIDGEQHIIHSPDVHDTREADRSWTRWQTQVALLAALHKLSQIQCPPPPPPPPPPLKSP